jgi:transposase InsO family protein
MHAWGIQFNHRRESFTVANQKPFVTIGFAQGTFLIEDTRVKLALRVVPCLSYALILGRDTLSKLPVRFFYGQRLLFSGHKPPALTPRSKAELPVGEGLRLLSPDQDHCKAVKDVVLRYPDVVSQWCTTPGLITEAAFRIPTGDSKPIYRSAIPLSQKHQELLQAHLDDYRSRGMIRKSDSPWGATTFLVPKPGSTEMRTCHDYRPLNKVTERHQYPMPSAPQLLSTIGSRNKFFAKIDLRWGYNQIPIQESDIPKTAITSPCGHDEWTVMNFGFTDAPAYFQNTIEKIIGDVLNKGAVVYLDDILIYAETFEDFLRILDVVLGRLNTAGAKIHIGKSDFLPTTLVYLGMVFSKAGVQHLPDRIKKLNTHPAPESLKSLRSFMGFANYFRSFIPKFAEYEGQLRQLPDRNFLYTAADKEAFEAIRSAVSTTSVLATFDPSLPIQLHVDASANGLGAMLCQIHPNNNTRVVAYASKLLSPVEKRYSNTERELLAIEWSVCERFRIQLTGLKFEVHTDHSALVHECRLKQPTSRIHRMLLKLDAFDLKIVYRPGKLNSAADFLSRLPDESVSLEGAAAVCSVKFDRQWVPATDRRPTIEAYHVLALKHMGSKKTYDAMCQRFFWPGMARDVKQFVSDCKVCCSYNTAAKPRVPVSPVPSKAPRDVIGIDIVGPMPMVDDKKYILVAIDHYTKYGFAQAVESVTADIICTFLREIFKKFGPWKSITMDNAKVFTGKKFFRLLKEWRVEPHLISVRHPEANGAVERFVRTLRQLLRKNGDAKVWVKSLPKVLRAYNSAQHTATSVTPVEGFLAKPAKFVVDKAHGVDVSVVRPVSGVPEYRASYAQAATSWKPGSKVWHVPRKSSKLKSGLSHFEPTRLGPYTVVGPDKLKQHLTVSNGQDQWPIPYWEIVI